MRDKLTYLLILLVGPPLFASGKWISLKKGKETPQANILSHSPSGLTLEISVSGVEVTKKEVQGKTYEALSIPEAGVLTDIGKPELPIVTKLIALPPHSGLKVQIIKTEKRELRGTYKIYPHQKPPYRNNLPQEEAFKIEESIYSSKRVFPSKAVEVREPVILRDVRFVPVIFYPVEYTPNSGKVQVITKIRLKLIYEGTAENPKESPPRGLTRSFLPLYKKFVLNFKDVYGIESVVDGSYLIIVYDNFYDEALQLANWRSQQGVEVHLVKGTDISNPPTFNAIYNYVYNAYHTWPKPPEYLLLIGDANQIPPGTGLTGFASDHKYATVEGDDYLPDIHVARLPVNTDASASYVIGKILKYERQPYMNETDWYKKIVTISRSDYVDDQNANRCGMIAINCGGFAEMDSFWESLGTNTVTNVSNAFNEGRSFCAYFDHGSETEWLGTTPDFTESDVQNLENYGKLPVIMDIACLNSKFDYSGGDCFSEAWMKAGSPGNEKGAIAIYGATTSSPFFYTDTLGRGFFLGYFCDSLRHYGEAADYAKLYMYQYFPEPPGGTTEETMQMHDPFGDPYQMFWTDIPQNPVVNFPSTVPMGPSEITVTVRWPDNSPVRGALVGVTQNEDILDADTTDIAGNVSLFINPATSDSVFITVTAHNLIPFIGATMPISSGPYVTYLNHQIDDSSGNGDGVVNPGETITMPTWVKNWGSEEAFGISGILTSGADLVTVTQDSSYFGDISPGDSALSSPDYSFEVSQACTNGYVVNFTLTLSDTAGSLWTSNFAVEVCTPQINADSFIVDDSLGSSPNGILDPGETANLLAVLQNSGCAGLTDVSLSITTTSPYLSILDGEGSLPEIPPETTLTNENDPFVVQASDSTPYGGEVSIILHITASGGYDETFPLSLTVGKGGDFLIWDPDMSHNSGPSIRDILDSLGYNGFYWDGSDLGEYRDMLGNFQSVFVCVGIYPNNHVIADGSQDAQALANYLNSGGKMYLEGGDVWYYDPLYQNGYNFAPLFGLNAIADGSGDLGTIQGLVGTFTQGMSFSYGGENSWIDHIQEQASGSFNIFENLSPSYYCGVAYVTGERRTVGTSFKLGGLNDGSPPSTKAALLDSIMHFFGVYANEPPNPFSLLSPLDGDTASLPLLFDWEDATDPNPGDQVFYDLYISLSSSFAPESTSVYTDLTESQYTLTSLPSFTSKISTSFPKNLNKKTAHLFQESLRRNRGQKTNNDLGRGGRHQEMGGPSDVKEDQEYNIYYWKVLARDNHGGETWSNQTWTFYGLSCQLGDANGDGNVDINDLTYLGNYLYQSGPEPSSCADMNNDGNIDSNDLVFLSNYLFNGGGKTIHKKNREKGM